MFETIYLKQLHHNEFIQFVKNFLGIVNENDLEVLKLKAQTDTLSNHMNSMIALYKPDKGSSLTKILQQDDERRDKAFRGIQALIRAYSYHYDTAVKAAADALSNSLKKYGTLVIKQNYQGETATIDAIIQEWKGQAELSNALNKLGLKKWLGELENANSDFNTHYLERAKEEAEAPEVKLASIREEATKAYRALASRIEAFAIIGEAETYATIIKRVNSLIEKYNAVVDARASKEVEEELPANE